MRLAEIGKLAKDKRIELGLTQLQIAKLSGLSRTTIVLMENGHLDDLGCSKLIKILSILGLNLDAIPANGFSDALSIAAKTSGTSYKATLSPKSLLVILSTGDLPKEFKPHLTTLLDETPLPLVVSAICAAAKESHQKTSAIMKNISKLAGNLGAYRKVW